jgi:hypothetical protein
MATETIYINGVYCKKKNYGIGISGKASDIIAEIQKHTNSKGYIRWELKERREPDKNGNSHYLVVDTWEPTGQAQQPQQSNYQSSRNAAAYGTPLVDDTDSDLPF